MRGIHIFPNLFTTMNLSFGFWAIVLLLDPDPGHHAQAAWLILFANVFDLMDGRVARWTKATSRFGEEFDSLADLVSFGVAPAILMTRVALGSYGDVGTLVALTFVACGALRLARFNVMTASGSSAGHFFLGCPIPAAATFLTSCYLYDLNNVIALPDQAYLVLTGMAACLMVTNIPYPAAKKSAKTRKEHLIRFFLVGFILYALLRYKETFIFLMSTIYILSGLLWTTGRTAVRLARIPLPRKDTGNILEEPHR